MANYIWITAVVLAVASTSLALNCYFCTDCENSSAISGPCPEGHNRCIVSLMSGKVQKSCAPQNMCDMANQAKDMMNNMKGLLGNGEMDAEMKAAGADEMPTIECCDTDYCNAAPNKMVNSALLILMPLALYFFHC